MRLFWAFAAIGLGCGGADTRPDNAAWETRPGFSALGMEEGEVDVGRVVGQDVALFDWVGVRHDLSLSAERETKADCACLAVGLGAPSDGQFRWRGPRPDFNPRNLALAISAFGVDCPGGATNKADRRPSIRGVFRKGADMIVEVEELPPDRPVATGAIVAPIESGGHVFIKPVGAKTPYAKPVGKALCQVK